jgi:hypothetical protein
MLRWMLGDEHFFTGMQNYFNDPEIANGFVRNEQFVKHMEIAGDTVLTEYFNDWYYGEGFPLYSAEFSPAGSGFIKIKLSQTTSHPSVDFFEMPVPVRVYNLDKTDSMDFRLNHLINNQEFIVPVNFNVSELKIDPDYWLISKTSEIVLVKDFKTDGELVVYPNPFVDFVRVSIPNKQQITSIKLFSINNKLLAEFHENSELINLSEFTSGIYIIQAVTPQKTFEEKIVKL